MKYINVRNKLTVTNDNLMMPTRGDSRLRIIRGIKWNLLLWTISCGLTSGGNGQSSAATAAARNIEVEWQKVSKLLAAPSQEKKLLGNPSDESAKSRLQQEIERLKSATVEAGIFRSKFPAGAHAAEAKKIEVLSSLRAMHLGMPDSGEIDSGAAAFLKNKKNEVNDRFEVALARACESQTLRSRRKEPIASADNWEGLADSLYDEFGAIPAVQAHYISLLRTEDGTSSERIIKKITGMQSANEPKYEVRKALERNERLGRTVELTLTTLEGGKISFSEKGKAVLVYFWNTIADLELLGRFKESIGKSVRVVYIGVGEKRPDWDVVRKAAPIEGIHCYDASSLAGAAALSLGVMQVPHVAALDADGRLVGFGPLGNVPGLMKIVKR